jgi:hypothetical protein
MMRSSRMRIKDPDQPKQPLNSFMMYYLDHLTDFLPGSVTELARKAGRAWRTLEQKLKSFYHEKANLGRQRYQTRKETYLKKKPTQEELTKKYGICPKRFIPSYAYFVKFNFGLHQRREPECSFADTSRALAKAWNNMTDEKKEKYYRMYQKDKKRWSREMNKYKEATSVTGAEVVVRVPETH